MGDGSDEECGPRHHGILDMLTLYKCYLREATVYVPTVGMQGGAYTIIDPVAVIRVTNTSALRHALHDAIARGNVVIPLKKGKWPPPRLLIDVCPSAP